MHRFRVATPADVDLIISIAREAYGLDACDWNAATAWVAAALASPAYYCLIGTRTVGFLTVQKMLWDKIPRAFVLYLFARKGRDWEPLVLLRTFVAYAKGQGAGTLEGGSETLADTGVLFRRLGAKPFELYRLELRST